MKITRFRLALVTLLLTNLAAASAYAHNVVLTIDKIKHKKGHMMVVLYNAESHYKSDTNSFAAKKIAVTDNTLTINFGDVPEGNYAIKLYQDANDNGKLDKNFMGIPTEGYGFSNNGGSMGQPSFDDAKFKVTNATSINIHLN